MGRVEITITDATRRTWGNRLDVIEKAIRGAFEKGDADDGAFRERVYRSAFAALDRALQANPQVTVEMAINRRKSLQEKITEIESEFIPLAAAKWQDEPVVVAEPAPLPAPTSAGPASSLPAPPVPIEPVDPPAAVANPAPPPAIEPASRPIAPAPSIDTDVSAAPAIRPEEEAAPAPPADGQETAPIVFVSASPPSDPAPTLDPLVAALEAPDPGVTVDPVGAPSGDDPGARPAPEILVGEQPQSPGRRGSEKRSADDAETISVDPDAAVVSERRRPFAAMFLAVTLVTAGAIGVWWAAETGLLKSAAERDTGVPNPSPSIDSEDFIPEDEVPVQEPVRPAETEALKDWITVFTPADASGVNAPSGTSAEVVQGEEGPVLRVRSGNADLAVLFDVGQGILEQMAGKHAIFDIVARAEEGKDTQISVTCNFGELGDCGASATPSAMSAASSCSRWSCPTPPPAPAARSRSIRTSPIRARPSTSSRSGSPSALSAGLRAAESGSIEHRGQRVQPVGLVRPACPSAGERSVESAWRRRTVRW